MWQKLARSKYVKGKSIALLEPKQGDSHYSSDILTIRGHYLDKRNMKVGNGEETTSGMILGAHP
jgi:hypothetical protein